MNTIKHHTRNIILAIASALALQFAAKAQTNTFPSDGNVGIGTLTPDALLEVKSSSAGAVRIPDSPYFLGIGSNNDRFALDLAGGDLTSPTAGARIRLGGGLRGDSEVGTIQFFNNATENMRIASNGNVGIGTTTPEAKLDVRGSILPIDVDARELLAKFGAYTANNDRLELFMHRFTSNGMQGGGWDSSEIMLQRVVDVTPMGYLKYSGINIILGSLNSDILRVFGNGYVGFNTDPTTSVDISVPYGRIQLCDTKSALVAGSNWGGAIYFGIDVAAGNTVPTAAIETSWGGEGQTNPQIAIGVTRDGNRTAASFEYAGNIIFRSLGTERMRMDGSGNVGIWTSTPNYPLTVNGAIRAKEVIVDSDWADYVFGDDYKLQSLDELEQHIKAEKHLPGIPSAAEAGKQGVSLGDMQTLLLSKIEELTLHQIDLNKRLNAQAEKLDQQSRQIDALRQENAALNCRLRQQ